MPAGDFSSLGAIRRRLVPIGDAALAKASQGDFVESAASPAPDRRGTANARGSLRTCNPNIATGFAPSDSQGAVGTNVDIGIYTKTTCGIISLDAGFAILATETLFDPRKCLTSPRGIDCLMPEHFLQKS